MLRDLLVNTSVLFLFLFVFTQLYYLHPLKPNSLLLRKMILGAGFGIIGSVLLWFRISIGRFDMDLRNVAYILSALYGGPVALIVAAAIATSTRMLVDGFQLFALLHAAFMIFGYSFISKSRLSHWKQWIFMNVYVILTTILITYAMFGNAETIVHFIPILTIDFLVSGFVANYYLQFQNRRQLIEEERNLLIRYDALTGLLHFQQFHKELSRLIVSGDRFLLLLIDCQDLKTMNAQFGLQNVNETLKKMADTLRIEFHDAKLLARYGDDEFAVLLCNWDRETALARIQNVLEEDIPKKVGVSLTYGFASYPEDAGSKASFVSAAEQHLHSKKRELWLEREENLFRTEKLRAVGELAAGMAHEIRNPLTSVKGFLQMAKENNKYNISPYYEIIMDEINRMNELTGEFLKFSKPTANSFRLTPIQNCVQHTMQLTQSEGLRLGHQIVYTDELMTSTPLLLDEDKMIQVLLNLIKNAFEAMQENGLVMVKLYRKNTNHVHVEVRDKGPGISKEHVSKLFQPFFTTKDNGTGLGLSICQKVIQDHDGTISVESELGVGTVFTISLPIPTSD